MFGSMLTLLKNKIKQTTTSLVIFKISSFQQFNLLNPIISIISRYCVEFEVIKASKACHKIPPYNQLAEGMYTLFYKAIIVKLFIH